MNKGLEAEQAAGRAAVQEHRFERPHHQDHLPDSRTDDRVFRAAVLGALMKLESNTEQLAHDNRVLRHQMERLMSASDDLKAAGDAFDARLDALGDLVGTGTTAILAAITAIVAGQNPDGSVPADVASAVVADMQAHLAAVEAKVAALGPAVVALDAAVHPAPAAPAAPPA